MPPVWSWIRLFLNWLFLPVFLLTLAVDQGSKSLVTHLMELGESIPQDGIVRITYTVNTGSAFGLFQNQNAFLIVASIAGIAALLLFYQTLSLPQTPVRVVLGLQLAGAIGNLKDRLTLGYVVDFIDLGWWPVFNVADSAIVVGMVVMAWLFMTSRGTHRQQTMGGPRALPPPREYQVLPPQAGPPPTEGGEAQ
ncbi:MAG: signal peptidase II [Chloroflexi bacterium]|nr:signal peptidase II [Chloroflexota bacterium]